MLEQQKTKEITAITNFRSNIICYRPGGNDTALVISNIVDPLVKRTINNTLMQIYPNIEQVGFVSVKYGTLSLNMAGGEFCGNATRSTAYLALNGKPGELSIKVSGVNNNLRAGVDENGDAFAQMPILPEKDKVIKDPKSDSGWFIEMEGITHYVDFEPSQIDDLTPEEIKQLSLSKIQQKGLNNFQACGIIYVRQSEKGFQIVPVVYVKDINTLFLESACGSGTCALGQVIAIKNGQSVTDLPVLQPSGGIIKISIVYEKGQFKYGEIRGPIDKISEGTIRTDKNSALYVIERLPLESFNKLGALNEIVSLYRAVFSEAPYFEEFSEDEVIDFFEEYIKKGVVLIARNDKGMVGFSAALSLTTQQELTGLASEFGIEQNNCQYIAELGVRKDVRRREIGQGLIEELLMLLPKNNILLRTTSSNIAAIELYKKFGFSTIAGMEQIVSRKRTDEVSLEDIRIFMIKSF